MKGLTVNSVGQGSTHRQAFENDFSRSRFQAISLADQITNIKNEMCV